MDNPSSIVFNRLRWARSFPDSANNFDLVLVDPPKLDSKEMKVHLNNILGERHRNLTLSSRASDEFLRWFDQPDSPLRSEAYVLLSNWFLTRSGDRHSTVASHCEALWDALFPCRPLRRLSSAKPGRNQIMLQGEFADFFRRLLEAQGDLPHENVDFEATPVAVVSQGREISEPGRLRARLDKEGLHCEVEGSPRALAEFLRMMSDWNAPIKETSR
jgi:hypothetical protein